MNTYLYEVTDMQRDAATGIVVSASFTIKATNGSDSYTHNYQTAFAAPKGNPIPYASLTKANVIEWIKESVGKQSEEQADAELAAFIQRKASTINNGTPW